MNMSGLARARLGLETGGRFPSGALLGDIAESWLRSLDHGIDPVRPRPMDVIDAQALRSLRQRHETLIRYARPELELLFDQISGSDFMIALGSPDGTVLDTLADGRFAASAAGKVVVPGSIWSEERRGTNAMGLTIKTRRPAQVYGAEHFLRDHGDVSCISAPIFDGRGALAGILDASTALHSRQQHTSALVQMSACNIENAYIRSVHGDSLVLVFHPRPEYLGTLSVGMLVLDEAHAVHAINRRGQLLLSGLGAVIGARFDELFEGSIERMLDDLARGETIRLRDRVGSAVSLRCVANRASFRLALRNSTSASVSTTPETPLRPAIAPWVRHMALEDATWRKHLSQLPELLKDRVNLLISGPSGVGKEVLARLAHALSRREGDFVTVDCSTLQPDGLSEQFFGCATDSQKGPSILDMAAGGTLFLDQIDALDPRVQRMLMRFLATHERPVQLHPDRTRADIQIIATSRLPIEELQRGDLSDSGFLDRINGFALQLPPLRSRTDFPAVVRSCLSQLREGARISDEAIAWLQREKRPEGFFELRTILRAALLESRDELVTIAHLGPREGRQGGSAAPCPKCARSQITAHRCLLIRAKVDELNGNIAAAARQLGLSRTTIYAHIR